MPNARKKNIFISVKEALFREMVKPLLKTGGELPSKKELALKYDVSVGTLDKALQELSVEGYLKKRMGSGTYVLPQAPCAGKNGARGVLSACWESDDPDKLEFGRKLDFFLQEAHVKSGREFRHYADMRVDSLRGAPLPQLVEDIERGKVSSLIAASYDGRLAPWLEKLSIPVVSMSRDFGWGVVCRDWRALGSEAARALVEKGVESAELLSSIMHEWESPKSLDAINRPLRAGMANVLLPLGLKAPERWLEPEMLPERLRDAYSKTTDETAGYELCKALFKSSRPDGLAVFTDCLAKGVVKALNELGLRLGRDVQAVSLGSQELDFPWLAGFERLDCSIKEAAESLMKLADAAERGEPPRVEYLRFKRKSSGGASC